MDPNANLTEQQQIAAEINRIVDSCHADGTFTPQQLQELAHRAQRLAELVEALDQWIARGGFLPTAWSRRR